MTTTIVIERIDTKISEVGPSGTRFLAIARIARKIISMPII